MKSKENKRGRPETRTLKIDATPEELARALVMPIKELDRPSVLPNDKRPPSLLDMPYITGII